MKKYFKVGLGVILPAALVFQVILWLGNVASDLLQRLTGVVYPWWGTVIGVIAATIITMTLGFVFTHFELIKKLKENTEEKIVKKIPLVGKVYDFGKDIVQIVTGDSSFKRVVMVEFPRDGQYSVGFVTNEETNAIVIPTTPNPTNGFLIFTAEYYELAYTTTEEGLKMIMSMGAWSNQELKAKWEQLKRGETDGI